MSQLYVVVLAVIAVALLLVAIFRTIRVKTKTDYLLAGRSLPAAYVIGRDGRVAFADAHADFRVRPEPQDVLAAVDSQ